MAVIEGGTTGVKSEVDAQALGQRAVNYPRGRGYSCAGITGTIAAALGANSSVFAMRLDPGASVNAIVDRMRIQYTTVVAYTTPLTVGRRLALFRGSGAAPTGGTSIAVGVPKDTGYTTSEFNIAGGGDLRIATTAALGVAGITFETDPIRLMSLSHVGAAGAFVEQVWEWHASENHPIILRPGQLIALRNPAAMDAAGTWQLVVNVDWSEQAVSEYA